MNLEIKLSIVKSYAEKAAKGKAARLLGNHEFLPKRHWPLSSKHTSRPTHRNHSQSSPPIQLPSLTPMSPCQDL